MRMHRFTEVLEYYPLELCNARSIVITSFFSHPSISHLDLEINQSDPLPPAPLMIDPLPETFERAPLQQSLQRPPLPLVDILLDSLLNVPLLRPHLQGLPFSHGDILRANNLNLNIQIPNLQGLPLPPVPVELAHLLNEPLHSPRPLDDTGRGISLLTNGYAVEKTFFCTEESFRNHLVPKRRLLYALNLDFPQGRESNLGKVFAPHEFRTEYESVFVAFTGELFFEEALGNLIEPALKKAEHKLKLLKWMADFGPLEPLFIPTQVQQSIAMILYWECVDSEIAAKCFERLFELDALLDIGKSQVLEYFLCNARLSNLDVRSKMFRRTSVFNSDDYCLVDYCIIRKIYSYVQTCLKYEDTVYYADESYTEYSHYYWRLRSFF